MVRSLVVREEPTGQPEIFDENNYRWSLRRRTMLEIESIARARLPTHWFLISLIIAWNVCSLQSDEWEAHPSFARTLIDWSKWKWIHFVSLTISYVCPSLCLSLHAKSVKITLVFVRRELVLSTLVIDVASERCEDEPNQSNIDNATSRSFLAINVKQ